LIKKGIAIDEVVKDKMIQEITERYESQTTPIYAAARLWTDAVIDPRDTRTWISLGIEAANHNPDVAPFNMGVLQV
jgi:3-methylcrotonyl-CoA carboxylase beta subunit